MTTFIADFIFGPPGRKHPRRPSLADRLMTRRRVPDAPVQDMPPETGRTDDTGSPRLARSRGETARLRETR